MGKMKENRRWKFLPHVTWEKSKVKKKVDLYGKEGINLNKCEFCSNNYKFLVKLL